MMLHGGDDGFCLGPVKRRGEMIDVGLMDGAAVFELHAVKKILHSSHCLSLFVDMISAI